MKALLVVIALVGSCLTAGPANANHCTVDGYRHVDSAGGPLCIDERYFAEPPHPITAYDDPAICERGYYQGKCRPQPREATITTTSPPAPVLTTAPAPHPVAARTPEPSTVDNGAILRLIAALTSLIPR